MLLRSLTRAARPAAAAARMPVRAMTSKGGPKPPVSASGAAAPTGGMPPSGQTAKVEKAAVAEMYASIQSETARVKRMARILMPASVLLGALAALGTTVFMLNPSEEQYSESAARRSQQRCVWARVDAQRARG